MSTASIDTVITDAGFDLLRAAPGHKLVYTRAVCGSGHVEKTQLATLTEISDYVMDLSIVEFGPSESAATLRLQLDNSKAPKEFQLYQIGVLAKLLDGEEELVGETLVQVMQYEKPDIVRAVPHVSEFVVNVLMGQAETVEGTIDMAAYVSIRQFSSRTVNGKPLSADVTITGEDIKVSVSDQTTVEAALSNKVSVPQPILPGTDLNVVTTPGMYYSENASDTGIQNAPNNDAAFSLLVENTGAWGGRARKQTYTPYNKNIVLTRILTFSGAGLDQIWTPWVQIAAATSQQEYDLLLENGIENNANTKSVYFVDPFGVVTVSVNVHGTNTLSAGTIIARIPEGFRPKRPNTVCVNTNAFLSFDPSGNIIVYTVDSKPLDANKWLVANVSFLAAGN